MKVCGVDIAKEIRRLANLASLEDAFTVSGLPTFSVNLLNKSICHCGGYANLRTNHLHLKVHARCNTSALCQTLAHELCHLACEFLGFNIRTQSQLHSHTPGFYMLLKKMTQEGYGVNVAYDFAKDKRYEFDTRARILMHQRFIAEGTEQELDPVATRNSVPEADDEQESNPLRGWKVTAVNKEPCIQLRSNQQKVFNDILWEHERNCKRMQPAVSLDGERGIPALRGAHIEWRTWMVVPLSKRVVSDLTTLLEEFFGEGNPALIKCAKSLGERIERMAEAMEAQGKMGD